MSGLVRTAFDHYEGAPRGSHPPTNLHATFNPFGSTKALNSFLGQVGSRRIYEAHPDSIIRMWALFGLFRGMNPEGQAVKGRCSSIATFRGFLGYLSLTKDDSSIFLVQSADPDDVLHLKVSDDGTLNSNITRVPGPGTPQSKVYKELHVHYVARSLLGQTFEGLPPISPEDLVNIYLVGLHCQLRGDKGTDYKMLLTPVRDEGGSFVMEDVTIRTSGLGIRPDVEVRIGQLPSGSPRKRGAR